MPQTKDQKRTKAIAMHTRHAEQNERNIREYDAEITHLRESKGNEKLIEDAERRRSVEIASLNVHRTVVSTTQAALGR